ncbi:P-loop NTPase fold protein [Corallococcus exercitus]|uniref:KAP family P-loop NTPase fold protein n=1 Tax=Corallococcus exercitus TaxID=2316736 RepID=UPI0035D50765
MWSDSETNRDFLNFRHVADTTAETIIQAAGRPLSIGISGGWGVGKSSMVKLIADSLEERGKGKFLFINFNAWLYQGYDDARAALMEVIAQALVEHGKNSKTNLTKAVELLDRVNWIRAATVTAGSVASMALGLPPVGLIGAALSTAEGLADGEVTAKDTEALEKLGKRAAETGKSLLRKPQSPPKAIHDIRECFNQALKEAGITMVVLIDDLDRCLPNTAISTLEAIRLFLFMERTAFIVAADDKMIRHAVRSHFKNVEATDDMVTNYFDKLIQIPIRVPPLGTQEVRAYIMLLFIENSQLPEATRDSLRSNICKQLGDSWQGKRVDRAFVSSLIENCPTVLTAQLELADRLAPLMTTAKQIAGNPRLIKRFLNTLSIRLSMARLQGVSVDEATLAKMLLFERCGSEDAYAFLISKINDSEDGKPKFLKEWEEKASLAVPIEQLPSTWKGEFITDWLALQPALADVDMRSTVYVSREHLPIITATDQLSAEGFRLLEALLGLTQQGSAILTAKVKELPQREVALIMDRLLSKARQAQEWSLTPILYACLTVSQADPHQASRFADFLKSVPGVQLRASIVPAIGNKSWGKAVLSHWHNKEDTPTTVKRAITTELRTAQ